MCVCVVVLPNGTDNFKWKFQMNFPVFVDYQCWGHTHASACTQVGARCTQLHHRRLQSAGCTHNYCSSNCLCCFCIGWLLMPVLHTPNGGVAKLCGWGSLVAFGWNKSHTVGARCDQLLLRKRGESAKEKKSWGMRRSHAGHSEIDKVQEVKDTGVIEGWR